MQVESKRTFHLWVVKVGEFFFLIVFFFNFDFVFFQSRRGDTPSFQVRPNTPSPEWAGSTCP